ncbi:MAG: ATP-dependent Clp protease ATP-binding subunit [Saprospiraceae bacterium]
MQLTTSIYEPLLCRAIEIAKSIAKENSHSTFGPAHLLAGIMHNEVGLGIELKLTGIDTDFIKDWSEIRINEYPKSGNIAFDPEPDQKAKAVLETADMIRLKLGDGQINALHAFIAICRPGVGFTEDQLKSYPVNESQLLELFSSKSSANGHSKPGNGQIGNKLPYLNKYTKDLSIEVLNAIIGREDEIRSIYEILSRYQKANVLLVGDPGVGKSSVIKGFIQFAINNADLSNWASKKVLEIDLVALNSGAGYKGELEDRFTKTLTEAPQNSILVIEDLHQLFEEKTSYSGIINILKSALTSGEHTFIFTSTADGLKAHLEKDKSFINNFEIVRIPEPNIELTSRILNSISKKLAEHHKITIGDDVLDTSIRLSKRYLNDRKLPDTAIGLVDQTLAAIRSSIDYLPITKLKIKESEKKDENVRFHLGSVLLNRLTVDLNKSINLITNQEIADWIAKSENKDFNLASANDVSVIISQKTGIPMGKMNSDEKERILNIENSLKKRVVGQDYAVENVSKAIKEARSGLNEPGKPIASVFFLGPTGTGKTELAKSLAEFLFDNEKALIRFDMSEFKESHSAALLYGAPPGYIGYEEGGMLVNKIRQQPYAVVLFDEIEKAHSSVFDIFLQIMDDGRLSDKLGKEGDFSNAVILFSSNIGSDYIVDFFNERGCLPPSDELKGIMENHFRKEFLGRISSIVPFAPIQKQVIPMILDIQLKRLKELAAIQGIHLEIDETAKTIISEAGFNPVYGARPLKEAVRTWLRQPLSKLLLEGKATAGNKITASGINNKIDFIIS